MPNRNVAQQGKFKASIYLGLPILISAVIGGPTEQEGYYGLLPAFLQPIPFKSVQEVALSSCLKTFFSCWSFQCWEKSGPRVSYGHRDQETHIFVRMSVTEKLFMSSCWLTAPVQALCFLGSVSVYNILFYAAEATAIYSTWNYYSMRRAGI